jgi:hypothetical protein
MNKIKKFFLLSVAGIIFLLVVKTGYTKVELKNREQKLKTLQAEASQLESRSDYIGATEIYKEINALREGRKYIRDNNPRETYEARKQATAKMLIDYIEVVDTQIVDEGVTATIVMKVRNKYNKTIDGLIDIYLMDDKERIVRTWHGALPQDGIPPGQTITINTPINKQKFSKIKIDGGSLREGN